MKSFFSAVAALSLLSLLASVTNALPNLAVNAEISAVKARTPSSPAGIAFAYSEAEGNFKQSRSLDSGSTDSDGEFGISATVGAFCIRFYARKDFQGEVGSEGVSTMCCPMTEKSGCCRFSNGPASFKVMSAIAPNTLTPAGGVYLWTSDDCTLTSDGVRWIDNNGVRDMSKEPPYFSMSLPKFYKK